MYSVMKIMKPAQANRRDNPCLFQVEDLGTFTGWGYQKGGMALLYSKKKKT
jgi:hypothetical protein